MRYYLRLKESWRGIEEMWVFLMDSVYRLEQSGNLIFEQFHKQSFESEILDSKYIKEFLQEIRN